MTKIARITALFLAILLVLTGCSGTTGESTTKAAAGTTAETKTLTVYTFNDARDSGDNNGYLEEIKQYDAANASIVIEVEEFNNVITMQKRLELELAAGQGPDIIIGSYSFGLDMLGIARAGAFYDMTDLIAADPTFTNDNYYLPVMKAGQIEGRQYVIPLSFTLPVFVSTGENLKKAGIDWKNATSLEVYEQMLTFLSSDDTNKICGLGGYTDTALPLMYSCGKYPVSYDTGEVVLDGEEEQMLLKLGTEIQIQGVKFMDQYADSTNFIIELAKLPLIYANYCTSPNQIKLYYSVYAADGRGDDFEMYFAPDDEGKYHAMVQEFAAVTAKSQNAECAWDLLHYIIDHSQRIGQYTSASLNRSVIKNHLRTLTTQDGKSIFINSTMTKLPQKYADQIAQAYDNISDATLSQLTAMSTIVVNGIWAYGNGQTTFDNMLDDMTSSLSIYLNE